MELRRRIACRGLRTRRIRVDEAFFCFFADTPPFTRVHIYLTLTCIHETIHRIFTLYIAKTPHKMRGFCPEIFFVR